MKKERPEYEALVPRIASGEISRKEAAEISAKQTGLSPGSFLVWLHTSGRTETLKHTRLSAGANNIHSLSNPDNVDGYDPDKAKAYEDAMALVTAGTTSMRKAAAKFGVSYPYLLKKARAAGLTQPKQPLSATPEDEDLVRAVLSDPARVAALAKAIRDAHV